MQNFIEVMKSRVGIEEMKNIQSFYEKVEGICQTEQMQKLFLLGQENTIIILPLELDYDMIFAGLILPLLRENLIDTSTFADYGSMLDLANAVLSIEDIDISSENDVAGVRNMLVAMAKDIRVIILKLASELNRFRRSKELSDVELYKLHKATNNFYVPLASRLGLSYIKSEFQDLDLAYSKPNEYKKLMKNLAEDNKFREEQIQKVKLELLSLLRELNINGEVKGRIKHISSVYNKIVNKHHTLSQIYDLIAMRVLVNSVNDCYSVLGAVHTKYTPLDGRFKDYIAKPKPNGYQSLHTTVLVDGRPLEIQIRTYEMHNHAEYGIAAHFLYKEKKNNFDKLDEKLLSIRKIIENPEISTSQDLINELKTDVYSGEIFVQSPLGKIVELPEFSTPIDFAYAIHSNIGNTCVGAKVNGKIVPINKQLKNADVVEIITSPSAKGPSKDWLSFVKSTAAKNKINQFFKKNEREDNVKKGKTMLEQSARVKDIDLKKYLEPQILTNIFNRYSLKSLDDMYAMIGCAALTTTQILNRMIAEYQNLNSSKKEFVFKPSTNSNKKNDLSSVEELKSMLIKFAGCCNPVPGDEIVGFISRGRGVTIHQKDCKSLKFLDADRLMNLTWNENGKDKKFDARIRILVKNKSGILANIANKIAEQKINISSINSKNIKDDKTIIEVDVAIESKESLNDLMKKLMNIADVYEVTRGENK